MYRTSKEEEQSKQVKRERAMTTDFLFLPSRRAPLAVDAGRLMTFSKFERHGHL